ncbi:MAG TPA: hypothetical protein VL334_18095 [Anaerolineae bacterium]|nr:hypothetical protein [Anaerolineae bacterium]
MTSIARQALFAGQLALYFPDTWQRTDQDGRRWQRFWQDQGLPASAAAWQLGSDQLDHALADSGVRFYNDPAIQARAAGEVAEALAWTPGGLPAGLLTLIAAGHNAFANQGEHLMTHGGLTLEDVIVPWVQITAGRLRSYGA